MPLLLVIFAVAAACAARPGPETRPASPLPPAPEAPSAEAGEEVHPPEPPAAGAPPEVPVAETAGTESAGAGEGEPPDGAPQDRETTVRPLTVVIDPGGDARRPSLIEASAAAKKQRRNAPPPVAVITNDNLAEYASRGRLTFVEPKEVEPRETREAGGAALEPEGDGAAATGTAGAAGEGAAGEPVRDEVYWRDGTRELRLLWRQAIDDEAELGERAESLRRRFYGEDDPYVRDTQVKPAWDRVLDRLGEARLEVEARRAELAAFLEEGRRSGALPGWLREGIELEPAPEEASSGGGDLETVEPTEPVTVEEGGGG